MGHTRSRRCFYRDLRTTTLGSEKGSHPMGRTYQLLMIQHLDPRPTVMDHSMTKWHAVTIVVSEV